ncbi:NAD(P)/FAD-dependent oxidoreductase [Ramlibacter sp. AN1015]|uniref:flavin-containing monooxygenase n=1 Tax=Ramlibacter sp. AN1015 TaxID=3133428 RepID=UPI0030C4C018
MQPPLDAIIVGAGFSGVCLGIRLVQAGIRSFVILEKNAGLGGCWHDNDYPGAACDVPSLLYSYSFAPKHDWSRVFSPREEIRRYIEDCARRFGVREHVRLNTEVVSATWDAERSLWRVQTEAGSLLARVFVSAVGQLSRPKLPAIPGLDNFAGRAFHSARFDKEAPIDGANVALVGSGASAIQIAPAIAPRVKSLTVFQRSPTWIVPKADRPFEPREKRRFARFPLIARYIRWRTYWTFERTYARIQLGTEQAAAFRAQCNAFIDSSVADPVLREKLRPDHAPSCKRVLKSNDWYPTLQRENVHLETGGVGRIEPNAIVTPEGVRHPVDTIIFATGFESTRFLAPMAVTGRGAERLDQRWVDGASAYWGIAVPGFPNFFMMYGPNTNAHNSIIFLIEAQARYIADMIGHVHHGRFLEADLSPEVMARFDAQTQERSKRFVWADQCGSWYKTAAGRITNNLPYSTLTYFRRTWRPDLADFEIKRAPAALREATA